MPDLEILKELLVGDLLEKISEKNGRRYAILKEDMPDSKLKKIEIYDIPNDSLLIKTDKCSPPNQLFNGRNGECKRCDYVLIVKFNDKKMILFIEIKSTKLKNKEIENQFKGSECLLDYCDTTLNRFFLQNDILKRYEKRFIVFYKASISKKPTNIIKPGNKGKTPADSIKYLSPIRPSLHSLINI